MGPVGFLESRIPTAGPATATSTQVLLSLLKVLLRHSVSRNATSTHVLLASL